MMHGRVFKVASVALFCMASALPPAYSGAAPGTTDFDRYFRPYVATNNFSGSVLIQRAGKVLFAKSYGLAIPKKGILNSLHTRYHIASLSILFTSTAVLRLIDQGKLSFGTRVSEIVPGLPNGDKITIRNLLEQNSGLPDSHDLPGYDRLLEKHQTAQTLVDFIRHEPPYAPPGGESTREEHSGQNVLALIIERKTGRRFSEAIKALVFTPLGMRDSGIDDDAPIAAQLAGGNQTSGASGLKPAPAIHWSALTGNGSAYTTVFDEWKWLHAIVHGKLLSRKSREAMLGTTNGFGWEKYVSPRVGETVYAAGGRSSGGFSCYLEYLPGDDTMLLALTNIENAVNPIIVSNAAALLRGRPYQKFNYHYVPLALAGKVSGNFKFGRDFYRKSATLALVSDANGVTLNWPGGPAAPLLPLGKNRFMDRYYWTIVSVVRDKNNNAIELDYGPFKGVRQPSPPAAHES